MPTVFLATALLAGAFLLHSAVVGLACLGGVWRCGPRRGPGKRVATGGAIDTLALFFALCLGMLVNMMALFALGLAGWLHLPAVAVAVIVLLVAGLMVLGFRHRRWSRGSIGSGIQANTRTDARANTRTAVRPTASATAGPPRNQAPAAVAGGIVARPPVPPWPEIAALGVLFLLCIASSLHPPGHWDDTMYQLPLARHMVESQAIMLQETLRFPLFPQSLNLLFALGLMLGDAMPAWVGGALAAASGDGGAALAAAAGPDAMASLPSASGLWRFGAPEVFAQAFATLPLFIMALGLWAASRRWLGGGLPGLIAGAMLFMIGPVKRTLGFAYVDGGMALFCMAAALAVACLAERPARPRDWLLPGLLAGAACGIKYFGLMFATLLAFVIVLVAAWQSRQARQALGAVIRAATVYGAAVLVAGGGWYLRSYLVSGDPAHPAGAPLFGFFLWNEGDLALQRAEQAGYGVGRNPLMLPAALIAAGALPWLPALAGLFLRRLPPAIRVMQAVFAAYLLVWFLVSQVPRYLAPAYGLGGFLALHALYRGWQWVAPRLAAARPFVPILHARRSHGHRLPRQWPAILVLALITAYAAERAIQRANEYRHWPAVLAAHPGYVLYQHANLHAAALGPRLVQIGFEDGVYFFRGTVIGDWFGPGRYRDLLPCAGGPPCGLPGGQVLRSAVESHGARMLLLSRRQVTGLDEAALRAAGWRVLATDPSGVLLALP